MVTAERERERETSQDAVKDVVERVRRAGNVVIGGDTEVAPFQEILWNHLAYLQTIGSTEVLVTSVDGSREQEEKDRAIVEKKALSDRETASERERELCNYE